MDNRTEIAKQRIMHLYGNATTPLETTDPDFAAIKERLIYGEIYQNSNLDAQMRELIILVVAATNQTGKELRLHTAAALACNTKPEVIKEAIYHCAPYIGLSKTEHAVDIVNEILLEHGITLPLISCQAVSEAQRLPDGIAAQKSIFGAAIDQMRASAPENEKHIQDYPSAYCFGDFYTRRGLNIQQRELLTFAILCAQGGCEPQVKAHVGGNASVGNGKEVLLAALTVCLPYIGFPRTLNALSCLDAILPEPSSTASKL